MKQRRVSENPGWIKNCRNFVRASYTIFSRVIMDENLYYIVFLMENRTIFFASEQTSQLNRWEKVDGQKFSLQSNVQELHRPKLDSAPLKEDYEHY